MVKVTIAGISFTVDTEDIQKAAKSSPPVSGLTEDYRRFASSEPGSVCIDFVVSDRDVTPYNHYKRLFDSSGLWKFHYNDRNDFRIEFKRGAEGGTLAFVDIDLGKRKGKIFYTEEGRKHLENKLFPFVYPVDQVIFENLLPSFNGILVHACGIDDAGQGLLFLGASGAGKSTTARLWADETGVKVLSDDRIIIREINNSFIAYGTPWHGELNVCDPGSVAIERMFFLEQSDRNYAKPLSPVEAATRMFVRCFPTFWDKEGMEFTLSFIDRVVNNVRCYELGFVPDKSAISFVRGLE